MDGLSLINEIKKKLSKKSPHPTDSTKPPLPTEKVAKLPLKTDLALATHLGITVAGIQKWKVRETITPRQVASLVDAAFKAGARQAEVSAIRPLVEFFKLEKCESRNGEKYGLFSVDEKGRPHPYLAGLRKEMSENHGVYVFFDSRGHAIYVGKARRQSLWTEMTIAFNRKRGDVQGIKKVNHPMRRQPYKTSEEKARQIIRRPVPLHDVAAYFSAYIVADRMIDELEAMLVRSFANDLLNVRMERFGSQRT